MSIDVPIPNEDVLRLAEKEEPRFLNILLRDKDSLSNAIAFGIKPTAKGMAGHFMFPKNNFLFTLIYKNYEKYKTVLTRSAMDSIIDQQDEITEEDKASAKTYWDKVWNRHDVALEDYTMLRDHINDRYILWQFYNQWKLGDQIIKASSDHGKLVKDYVRDISSIDNMEADPYSRTMGITEGMSEALKYIDHRRDHPEDTDTIKTYIKALDEIFEGGLARGSYCVISGTVNGGKTTLLMNIGFNMAKAGYNVVYVSLEKDAPLFFRRVLALHSGTQYNRIKIGGTGNYGLTDYWYKRLKDAAKDLTENIKPHYDCLQFVQGTKLTKILSEVDKIKAQKRIDVLIVDYLQVIGFESSHPTRPDLDLAEVHRRLQAYGKTDNMLTFTALQLKASSSKEIRNKASKATSESEMDAISINTEDFSGSQMIIADADNALGVFLNKDKPPTKMGICVTKARDDVSRINKILDFDGRVGRVSDQILGDGQVQAVKDLLFNKEISEEQLASEDGLFKSTEEELAKNKVKTAKEEKAQKVEDPSKEINFDEDIVSQGVVEKKTKEEKTEIKLDVSSKSKNGFAEKEVSDDDISSLFGS